MLATIDKAGRLVIPKAIREAMSLQPGTLLDISFSDGKIFIDYAPVDVEVRKVGKIRVLHVKHGDARPIMTDQLIQDTKDEIRHEREARWV